MAGNQSRLAVCPRFPIRAHVARRGLLVFAYFWFPRSLRAVAFEPRVASLATPILDMICRLMRGVSLILHVAALPSASHWEHYAHASSTLRTQVEHMASPPTIGIENTTGCCDAS